MRSKETRAEAPEISQKIHIVRGQRVLLDSDLAVLYGVKTRVFKQAVRRNIQRFPEDFLLTPANQEVASLRSQIVTLKTGRGQHSKYRNMAFTEHGAVMAATILNSPRAIQMSVYVVRTFVRLRALLASSTQLARKLDSLEKSIAVLDVDAKRQFKELRGIVFALAGPPVREQ